MPDLIRDSVFGHLVRLATGPRFFPYADELDPSLGDKYVNPDKSAHLALYGTLGSLREAEEKEDGNSTSPESSAPEPTEGPETDGGTRSATHTSPPAPVTSLPTARIVSNGSTMISRLQSSDARPVTSHTNSFLNEVHRSRSKISRINTASGREVDAEKGRDIHLVDWDGPEDPDNPRNWSQLKKVWVTFALCVLTFAVYVGASIYTAGLVGIMETFNVSRVAATVGLTLFVLGYAVGPMLFSPMSEFPAFGRGPIYIGTLVIFVALQVPTALATNFGMLMAFRFLGGFFGSPVLATGGASIADLYSPAKRTYGMGIWGISAVLGPTMGPLLGGFAADDKGWHWPIWILMWMSGGTLAVLFFFLPETSSANILYRRSRRLRKQTGNDKLRCEAELISENMTSKEIVLMVLVRPFTLSFLEPVLFSLNMYLALVYALLYMWLESFPIVFIEIYHFTNGTIGLAFLGILIGNVITFPVWAYYFRKYTEPKFNDKGDLKPEDRLPPAFVGAFALPICLFMFGWTARESVHWIVPIIATGFFGIGAFTVFMAVLNYLPDAYPEYAASVLAGNDLFRSAFGAAFPLFAGAMYHNLGVDWASSLLGFLAIAFIPLPFLLYRYGLALRQRSKHARQD